MSADGKLKGSCQCGAVRYEVSGPVRRVDHCHCSMCRKLHGSLFVSFGVIDRGSLTVSGGENLREFKSSQRVRRRFCGLCGGQVFTRDSSEPDRFFLCLGSLDAGEVPDHDPATERHIFWESKATWHDPGDRAPRVDGHGMEA